MPHAHRIARSHLLLALALFGWSGCDDPVPGPGAQPPASDPAGSTLGETFVSGDAEVNGTRLHYLRGGTGPAVVLLHGFPQDWWEFHQVMPRLARTFTVVVVDLRGIGGSRPTPAGYDTPNLAEDIHQLTQRLQLGRFYLVGHDLGGMVAYAYARLHPAKTRGVMILDVPLPGVEPWEQVKMNPMLWHFGFHQVPGLAEQLVAGRQVVYFREFFDRALLNPKAISDNDVAHYAASYSTPEQLRAGFEFYRAFPADEAFGASPHGPIAVPVVLAGGDHSFGPLGEACAQALRTRGFSSVTVETIANSGHYVVDEQPASVAALVERYGAM